MWATRTGILAIALGTFTAAWPGCQRRTGRTPPAAPAAQAGERDAAVRAREGTPGGAATTTATGSGSAAGSMEEPDAGLLGDRIAGEWIAEDEARVYPAADLHLLVNGGDAVFHKYGVRWAAQRTYRDRAEADRRVQAELYAFGDAAGAAGRYRHEAIEAGPAWVETPAPDALEGKVDAARLDADQLRMTRGRFLAILRYEDAAAADAEKLNAGAAIALPSFGIALAEAIDARTDPGRSAP